MATTYSMDFNFDSVTNTKILEKLQHGDYMLLGFKGAKGPSQVTAGVPVWFAVPFGNIFGEVAIDYTPLYKVYVFNKAKIAAFTTISMQRLSAETALGNALVFNQNGSFTSGGSAKAGTISLRNDRPATTPELTVGLAGLVNTPAGQQYLPFCAFTLPPQNAISMEPIEQVALFAARVDLQSGNVQAAATAPGCTFPFDSGSTSYALEVEDNTFEISNAPGGTPVTPVGAGTTLTTLLNS